MKLKNFTILWSLIYVFHLNYMHSQQLEFKKDMEGILLLENNAPRYFYQTKEKSINGEFSRSNYIHPLYSLSGEPLTEDFPEDHLHHRGIFWSWHQLYVNNDRIGDPWLAEGIILKVEETKTTVNGGIAKLYSEVLWVSELNLEHVMKEKVTITYERLEKEVFALTFDVELSALVEGLAIGGSEDEKGYGGFSVRLKLPEDVAFNADKGKVEPRDLPVQVGDWVELSGDFDNSAMDFLKIVIMAEPSKLPSYHGWILRSAASMQNIAFPGRQPLKIPIGRALKFRNQILVHNGLDKDEIKTYYSRFSKKGKS